MIEADGWNNHEDTFEEALRRELLEAKGTIFLLQDDIKQLTEAYYSAIKRIKELNKDIGRLREYLNATHEMRKVITPETSEEYI